MATIDVTIPQRRSLTAADLRTSAVRRRREAIMRWIFRSAAMVSILVSVLIILSLVQEAWTFIDGLADEGNLGALSSIGWFPRRNLYDISTIFMGSVIVTAVALVIAIPLGLGASVYLAEYANPRVRRTLKPILEVLAGIPSVVLGFFALTVINPEFVQQVFAEAQPFNLLAAGIGVGILTVPLIASISEDALRSVPNALREASAGLGARKKTTTLRVVVPAAVSGLVAAFIVGISRAMGETMVVAIAAGASGGALYTVNPLDNGQTMTAAMASLATGTDQVKGASLAFQSLFFVGLLLFFITLILNIVADRFVTRVRKSY